MRLIPIIHLLTRKREQASSGWLLFLIAASGLGTLGLVVLAGLWAGTESDAAALERQRQLMTARLHDQVEQAAQIVGQIAAGYVALSQPAQGIGDASTADGDGPIGADATPTIATATMARVATTFFRYDQAFIVDGAGQLAMDADAGTRKRFNWMRSLLRPFLDDPRLRPAHPSQADADPAPRAIAELMRLEGRATIVGTAAVGATDRAIAASREPGMPPEPRYLIAIRFLDGTALDALSREQGLNGARYARAADPEKSEVAFQIDSTITNEPIGFIVWTPDLPGSRVIGRLAPALSLAAVVIAVLFSALLMRLRRSLIELRASEHQARHLSLHDVLTTLPNRALFAERLEACLSRGARDGRRHAVALIDLDRFKAVNDTFGHAAGDELIRLAASRMAALLRPQDTLARLGGDEFALLLPNIGDGDEVVGAVCRGLVDVLARPFELMSATAVAHVGGSIGVVVPEAGQSVDDAMRHADTALYEAKAQGRGRWVAFVRSMDGGRHDRDTVRNELRTLLASLTDSAGHQPSAACPARLGKLELHFQTIHRAKDGCRVSGAEALVRWRHGERGLLFPDSFISVAEEGGLIDDLGLWVLREACREASAWDPATFVAVNVSPHQLRRSSFSDDVLAVLAATGLSPSRLELELTESAFIDVEQATEAGLARLRAEGVQIALDDFGTGFSSLSDVVHLGVDRIKIDRSFVALLGTKAHGAAIVAALVGLGRNLGIATTAEGVETQAQRDFLVALGCTDLQGYLFSRPEPIETLGRSQPLLRSNAFVTPQVRVPAA
ncbi:putative bifunctional diguanylate cyclase/phosphodiesterase [Aureimonas jatrophae]|uniref:Diguanylate cyclase (GGDEF) domain-containing protein n=1 Tax=Aureimonas jatrophae TaxID=1166073 RepID=A0A1H0DG32_9HYPH|nr:EAL domain-containing protein [Aureimonas jatrophae]MBB3951867.1 diguanylate cyclase (GGDEF)-like protein [Aureimonas jatrophae]SDN68951.1 diguanylate cyclase (GGDEF) domain-containing protein [Aureimonas jatrophae]